MKGNFQALVLRGERSREAPDLPGQKRKSMKKESRYEIIDEKHGEGGFGKIQKQKDKILERLVAVKELKIINDEDARQRFFREAKTLARMTHPNVPSIYDVEFLSDEMRIYFEYVEGENLRKIISEKTIPTIEQVRKWFSQVASALGHAHELGIIHRDVKPENIIISADATAASLVDFGIALTQDDVSKLTESGYVIGTQGYMSPEQMAGEELDGRSDLYSLGVTLYEVFSGHLPLPGQYQSLADLNEAIPPAVDELIRKCLTQDKKHRISDTQDFIQELQETIRTDIPLSSLLTDARLHEILAALNQLAPEEFHAKPIGQRLLIINRLKDLLRLEKKELQLATGQLIIALIRLAIFESPNDFEGIVEAAFQWGFDKRYTEDWQGEQDIRNALIATAKQANEEALNVLSKGYLEFVNDKPLSDLPGWSHHDLRKIVIALLANPKCGDVATDLAKFYDLLNQVSH